MIEPAMGHDSGVSFSAGSLSPRKNPKSSMAGLYMHRGPWRYQVEKAIIDIFERPKYRFIVKSRKRRRFQPRDDGVHFSVERKGNNTAATVSIKKIGTFVYVKSVQVRISHKGELVHKLYIHKGKSVKVRRSAVFAANKLKQTFDEELARHLTEA